MMKGDLSCAQLILAGIIQRRGRSAALVFCYLSIAAGIFSAQYVMIGTAASAGEEVSRMGADLLVVSPLSAQNIQGRQMGPATIGTIIRAEPGPYRLNASVMTTIGRVQGVAAMSPQLFVATLADPGLSDTPVDIYGIDPVSDFTVQAWLARPLTNPLGSNEVITGSAIRGDPGSSVTIGGTSYRIAGKLSMTGTAADETIFMDLDDAYALASRPGILSSSSSGGIPAGLVNAILIKTAPGADPGMVASRIQQPFSYDTLRVLGKQLTLRPVSQEIRTIPQTLDIVSMIVILASLPLIAIITAMTVHERQREIGLMVAMGATKRFIFLMVLCESLILAGAGGIAGSLLGAFILMCAGKIIPGTVLDGFPLPPAGSVMMMAAVALAIVICIGAIAAFPPAYRICRKNPYDAIRSAN